MSWKGSVLSVVWNPYQLCHKFQLLHIPGYVQHTLASHDPEVALQSSAVFRVRWDGRNNLLNGWSRCGAPHPESHGHPVSSSSHSVQNPQPYTLFGNPALSSQNSLLPETRSGYEINRGQESESKTKIKREESRRRQNKEAAFIFEPVLYSGLGMDGCYQMSISLWHLQIPDTSGPLSEGSKRGWSKPDPPESYFPDLYFNCMEYGFQFLLDFLFSISSYLCYSLLFLTARMLIFFVLAGF